MKPDQVTLVPERRQELTTEGGLDVIGNRGSVTAAIAKLVGRTGDLRASGALLETARGADASARAAAIEALGALGDGRVIEIATGSLDHEDPRVRTAAASALVALGSPAAARAVEGLDFSPGSAARGAP